MLRVTRYADDGDEGSLRFAIEASNRAPGRYRIEIEAVGSPPYVIKPAAPLPAVKGPAKIEGAAWKRSGEFIILDGTGYIEDKGPQTCPGAVPGQFGANVRTLSYPGLALIDTSGVDISGLDIRNFCIGILIHRSSGNVIHDNRVVANRGGAGVLITGDDGNGGSTATTTMHNKVLRNEFLDNGDGAELTRGAAFNLIADNVFRSTSANPEPSQGIEILEGNDNVLTGNRFEGYSDGVQLNRGNRNYLGHNVFTDNTLGLSLTGHDNIIDGNTLFRNKVGIAVRPTATGTMVRLSRNAIYDNGRDISALLHRRQLRSRSSARRHRARHARPRARPLCRPARHRRRRQAGKPRQDLPGRRARLPAIAERRHRATDDRARATPRRRGRRGGSCARGRRTRASRSRCSPTARPAAPRARYSSPTRRSPQMRAAAPPSRWLSR